MPNAGAQRRGLDRRDRAGLRWIAGGLFLLALLVAQLIGPLVERGLLLLALAATLAAVPPWPRRAAAGPLALALRFAGDDFGTHVVWSLSAPELPLWLKLASLWAGDEGTLLLLGLLGLLLALRLERQGGWAGPGAYLLAAAFVLGALVWAGLAAALLGFGLLFLGEARAKNDNFSLL